MDFITLQTFYFFDGSSIESALMAAFALFTLFLLLEKILLETSLSPANSKTVRTDEPAKTPFPGALIIRTLEEENLASTS